MRYSKKLIENSIRHYGRMLRESIVGFDSVVDFKRFVAMNDEAPNWIKVKCVLDLLADLTVEWNHRRYTSPYTAVNVILNEIWNYAVVQADEGLEAVRYDAVLPGDYQAKRDKMFFTPETIDEISRRHCKGRPVMSTSFSILGQRSQRGRMLSVVRTYADISDQEEMKLFRFPEYKDYEGNARLCAPSQFGGRDVETGTGEAVVFQMDKANPDFAVKVLLPGE